MAVGILFELSRALALVVAYIVILATYRLYFSPLAKFPGPKIAAVTSLYHYYYDVIKGGQYVFVIEEMHKKYGPIVRTRPDVLHMNDPEYIDPILGTPGKRRDKYKIQLNGAGAPGAAFGTEHHELHRRRRAPLNPFFSKQNIRRLEPVLHRCLGKILGRLAGNAESGKPMKMNILFNAATSDIISDYCFGESYNNLDKEDLNEPYVLAEHENRLVFHFATFNPWLLFVVNTLPQKVVVFFIPGVKMFIEGMKEVTKRIKIVREEIKDNTATGNSEKTVFHSLLMNSNVPDSDKTDDRMAEEARILLLGGTDTTAMTLSAITYHILANPSIFKQLKAELTQAIPDPDSLPVSSQIEALPYLTAVIEEGIRLHPAGSGRQERVAPDEDLIYQDTKGGRRYMIPKGTPVGLSAPIMNMIEDIYPSPTVFDPNRFLENPRLDKYKISFSRGPRRCLGMNLAYSELYMLLVGIFRKYDLYDGTGKQAGPTLELYKTTREDVDMAADSLTPVLKEGSLGVRVIVR